MEVAQEVMDAPADAKAGAPEPITTAVAEYDPTAQALNELRKRLANRAYDLRTVKGNDEARADRKRLVSLRTSLEKLRLDMNRGDRATIEERIKLRDTEARRITEAIEELETPIDEQIKADEARREQERLDKIEAEARRVAAIRARIEQITAVALRAVGQPAAEIEAKIKLVVGITIGADFVEFQAEAELAKAETLNRLRELHAAAVAAEAEAAQVAAERAELARLRAEQEERDRIERERVAEQQRVEAARLATERAAFEQEQREARERQARADAEARERQERADAEARAAREEADRLAAAERAEADRIAREARAAEEQRLAAERERLRAQQEEQDRIAREQRETEERREAAARAERRRQEEAAAAADQRVRDAAPRLLSTLSTLVEILHGMDLPNEDDRPTEESYQAALAQADLVITETTGA